ncbi:MAG: hypothetical protein Q8O89_03465 [Nanoarchaeota archaeon]|nr:hypothetical protein [Nanoarchaeota archaeon]
MVYELKLASCLKLPIDEKGKIFPLINKVSTVSRKESVDEAISLKSGKNQDNKEYHEFYKVENYRICFGKPGKEAAPDYKSLRGKNVNDMTPTLFIGKEKHENTFSFDNIFEMLNYIGKKDEEALELIGCVIFRCAYMLDHHKDAKGRWRLTLPEPVITAIESKIEEVQDIPVKVFLYVLEAIALNEDVKYHTLNMNPLLKEGTGRRNNLLTYCHLISILLGRLPFAKFAGSFARPPIGISALTQKDTFTAFPLLKPNT